MASHLEPSLLRPTATTRRFWRGTLDTMEIVGELPERLSTHLDRCYDSQTTREKLHDRGLLAETSEKGRPDPLGTTKRWVVERTNSWTNAHKKLVWCTERREPVIDFWLAFSQRFA